MNDKFSVKRKIMAILVSLAKDYSPEELGAFIVSLMKAMGNYEGQGQGLKEVVASVEAKSKALQEFIDNEKDVEAYNSSSQKVEKMTLRALVDQATGDNYSIATFWPALMVAQEKFTASLAKVRDLKKSYGGLTVELKDTVVGKDAIEKTKKQIKTLNAKLEKLEKTLADMEHVGKGGKFKQLTTDADAIYGIAKEAAKEFRIKKEEEGKKKKDEKPAGKPADKPAADKPGQSFTPKAPSSTAPGLAPAFPKKPAPAPGKKTSLDGDLSRSAADADAALIGAMADVAKAEAEILDAVTEADEELDVVGAEMIAIADEGIKLVDDLKSSAPAEDAPAEDAPAADVLKMGPNTKDLLDNVAPEAPADPAQEDRELALSNLEDAWTREADVKLYPSEYDMSGGVWDLVDVVEADGSGDSEKKQQFVINKDLKARITKKVKDIQSGAFKPGQSVMVDNGDHFISATIKAYAGEGMYDVDVNGEVMRGPAECIFVPREDLWR